MQVLFCGHFVTFNHMCFAYFFSKIGYVIQIELFDYKGRDSD